MSKRIYGSPSWIVAVSLISISSISISSFAAPDKYEPWKKQVLPQWNQYSSNQYSSYYSMTPQALKEASPSYNGKFFILDSFNKNTYRLLTSESVRFDTFTTITTNVSNSSSLAFNTEDFFDSTITKSTVLAGDWVTSRANYLETTFALPHDVALSTAVADRTWCEGAGTSCGDRLLTTHYNLETFGPNDTTTVSAPTTTVTTTVAAPTTTLTTAGNTTVRSTVNASTTSSATSVTTSTQSTSGSIDTLTTAQGAAGGPEGSVDQATKVDTRTTVDTADSTDTTTTDTTTKKEDRQTTTRTTSRVKGERHWDYNIAPMIFADFSHEKKIVSLNTHYPSVSSLIIGENGETIAALSSTKMDFERQDSINNVNSGSVPTLKIEDDQKGAYRVELRSNLSFGAGISMNLKQVNAGTSLGGFVGLAPIHNASAVTQRTVMSQAEAKSAKAYSVPGTAEELAAWKTYDKLSWASTNGILFVGGLSYGPASVGASYTATGTWTTEVQKVGSSKVYVKVANTHLHNFTPFASLVLLNASAPHYWTPKKKADYSFSFMFDLANNDAAVAYAAMIQGNMLPAQKIAGEKDNSSVIAIESNTSSVRGKLATISFGIPFVALGSASRGTVQMATVADSQADNTHMNAEYGVYIKSSDVKSMAYDSERTFGFYGTSYTATGADKSSSQGAFGQIGWTFKQTDTSPEKLADALQRLVVDTGMKNELAVNVPKLTKKDGDLSYVSIEFLMKLDRAATESLMGLNKTDSEGSTMARIANGFIDSYLTGSNTTNAVEINRFCLSYPGIEHNSKVQAPRTRDERIKDCAFLVGRETLAALQDMNNALREMNAAYQKDDKAFAAAYAKFGKGMLTNQFTFQTVFNLVKGRGVSARYNISGTKIASYDLNFDWSPSLTK